jgi:predicted phosphate transport protein (TIGR00153 family)
MKLDHWIRKLVPHDDKFFMLLEKSAQNLVVASDVLNTLPTAKSTAERKRIVERLRDLEHEGDSTTHEIFSELNGTFVTPMDREDIHLLASSLDDIMDHIDGSAARVVLYDVKILPPAVAELTNILHSSIAELRRGIGLLRDLHNFDELQKVFETVNKFENDADDVFERAVAELFRKEKRPIELIKLKEIYVGLETATDKCEDVANILEAIVIKNA